MTTTLRSCVMGISACVAMMASRPGLAQTADFAIGEMMRGPIVRDAPYSAEAVTTLKQTLGDGTHIERRSTAKIFRDSAGRVRREQNVIGLEALNPSGGALTIVTIVDPVARLTYVLDANLRIASRTPMASGSAGSVTNTAGSITNTPPPPPPPPPIPGTGRNGRNNQRSLEREFLFNDVAGGLVAPLVPFTSDIPETVWRERREIDGLMSRGAITRATIPVGAIGNDRAIEMMTERWESPDLKVIVLARHSDPRIGELEYRLTNVKRGQPAADLFKVPAGYRVIDGPPLPPPPPPPPPQF